MEMKPARQPTDEEKALLFQQILDNATASGYFINPDRDYDLFLMNGLLVNQYRYGYQSCPCRLSKGIKTEDADLVCPCDYRDADLNEFGMCYCSLYVSKEVVDGKKETGSIPERRPQSVESAEKKADLKTSVASNTENNHGAASVESTVENNYETASVESVAESDVKSVFTEGKYPVWRCKVCGYLCAREHPPELCPICKADKERFERFA